MYNRYIPQPDGSYSRRSMPDTQSQPRRHQQPQWQPTPPPCDPQPEPPPQAPCPPQPKPRPNGGYHRRPQPNPPRQERKETYRENGGSVMDFLRQLLPRDFDTGDLLIVLLLLLMAGDCQEDQNTALLTLALYLFM